MSDWKPIPDRSDAKKFAAGFPKDGKRVLAVKPGPEGPVIVLARSDGNVLREDFGGVTNAKYSHWMPAPELPREKEPNGKGRDKKKK